MADNGMGFVHHDPVTGKGELVIDLAAGAILDDRVWCPHCLTSAAIRVEILALTDAGFKILTIPTWCDRCRVFLTKENA